MTMDYIIRFVINSSGNVIANHLEAVNHCPISRKELASELSKHGLIDKTHIPKDGQIIAIK